MKSYKDAEMKSNCRADGPWDLKATYGFHSEAGASPGQSCGDATRKVAEDQVKVRK